jgi:hypothetical protein
VREGLAEGLAVDGEDSDDARQQLEEVSDELLAGGARGSGGVGFVGEADLGEDFRGGDTVAGRQALVEDELAEDGIGGFGAFEVEGADLAGGATFSRDAVAAARVLAALERSSHHSLSCSLQSSSSEGS